MSIGYHLRQAASCLAANPWAALVSALTVGVALAIATGGLVLLRTVEGALAGYAGEASITVFLAETDASEGEARAAEVAAAVRAVVGEAAVEGVSATYVSPETALARLQSELGELGEPLSDLAVNPLPPTVEVRLPKPGLGRARVDVRAVAARLEALPFAREVDYGRAFLDRLEAMLRGVRAAGLVGLGLLAGVALFLVGVVVRLTVYARRGEIEILRLVGATDAFVATPFVLEGAAQGLVGGVLAAGLVAALERWVFPAAAATFGFGEALVPAPSSAGELGLLVVLGVGAAAVASLLAVVRFLRRIA